MISATPVKESQYYASDRFDVMALIPDDVRKVLDVGCGYGNMAKRLKEERGIEVIGIEKEERAVNIAKNNVDKLIIGDVEDLKLPLEEGYFDCIVYGDVLEHLKEPWKLLKKQTYYLKKGGCCIASIPNIAHYSIIKGLINDKWEYASSGIMDRTHLRFFTIETIRRMLKDAGYVILEEKRYIRASKSKKLLNKLLRGRMEHLLTEQYIVKGRLDHNYEGEWR